MVAEFCISRKGNRLSNMRIQSLLSPREKVRARDLRWLAGGSDCEWRFERVAV